MSNQEIHPNRLSKKSMKKEVIEAMDQAVPKGHTMKHHKDSDMYDQGYLGKHPDGYSHTQIDHQKTKTHEDIHAEVKRQNPHLSAETHKVISKAVHDSF